jgi:DNA invertase Pin-like site-specific DNA recombinase
MVDKNNSKLRAVGYSRTSSEGQRDNTSIPRQKEVIEQFIKRNEWVFVRHYVDESLSGSKVEGRNDFQRMMRDATQGEFDVIVPWDMDRFARDGCDIIYNARFLKRTFSIHVVDTKGLFDNRDHRKTLVNYVKAGLTEDERLRIMERTIGGRIKRAKDGQPWTPRKMRPYGRDYDKETGEWYVTEKGHRFAELVKRYADGESLTALAPQYSFKWPQDVCRIIRKCQLSGTYMARFNSPEIGINHLEIPVPKVPEVITPELEARVRERMAHNQTCNQQTKRKYIFTGFIYCSHCGRSLTGQTDKRNLYSYYRHSNDTGHKRGCPFRGIRGDLLENHVLDNLYQFYLDKPTYYEAIKSCMPSDEDRKVLEQDLQRINCQLGKSDKEISNLVNAVAAGADVNLLLDRQNGLKAEKQALEIRRDELRETLSKMPNAENIEHEAMRLRLYLMEQVRDADWHTLPYEVVRRYLHFLFSDNPRSNGYGIFVGFKDGYWHITFKGVFEFYHDVENGRLVSHELQTMAEVLNARTKNIFRQGVEQAKRQYDEDTRRYEEAIKEAERELEQCNHKLKPETVNELTPSSKTTRFDDFTTAMSYS